jgi:D-glycero-alpha-D-manno-heptose-7-phosphate kinase
MTNGIRRSVHVSAPVRTADLGGWTDTWFCKRGTVCSIALDLRVEVRVTASGRADALIKLTVAADRSAHLIDPNRPSGRHPLIEAAIAACPPFESCHIAVGDSVPLGAGVGTSSALTVAMVAALDAFNGGTPERSSVASHAQKVESTVAQCGVQDHWSAAFGGFNVFDVAYPAVKQEALALDGVTVDELARRLHTVYFGRPHASSDMHLGVIQRLQRGEGNGALDDIRHLARLGADALLAGELATYGEMLTGNHEAIRALDPRLVPPEADRLAALARRHGADGWKINGAGGSGGSMVVLGPAEPERDAALLRAIAHDGNWLVLDCDLDLPEQQPGLRASLYEGPN